ncbi:uncharacterized protein LOC143152652 isoform X2 [Ptiloglossa arizonensis]|uniref:uncharacterized protein LOC143152652 isoform X2 n=1 Tax=Ptiloglossa arizonensis TaxID=3350558 RepID=UPI003FA05EDE
MEAYTRSLEAIYAHRGRVYDAATATARQWQIASIGSVRGSKDQPQSYCLAQRNLGPNDRRQRALNGTELSARTVAIRAEMRKKRIHERVAVTRNTYGRYK